MNWQLIDTAPRYRIRIIGATKTIVVGDVFYGQASYLICKLMDEEYVRERSIEAWRYSQGEDQIPSHMIPTHWMPLPELPV